jgi:hypothetical protein
MASAQKVADDNGTRAVANASKPQQPPGTGIRQPVPLRYEFGGAQPVATSETPTEKKPYELDKMEVAIRVYEKRNERIQKLNEKIRIHIITNPFSLSPFAGRGKFTPFFSGNKIRGWMEPFLEASDEAERAEEEVRNWMQAEYERRQELKQWEDITNLFHSFGLYWAWEAEPEPNGRK